MLRHAPPCLNRTARQDVDVGTCRIGSGPFVVGSNKASDERVNHHRSRERATASPSETEARDPLIGIQALAITRRETAAKHAKSIRSPGSRRSSLSATGLGCVKTPVEARASTPAALFLA
jgi:hypothetical protein